MHHPQRALIRAAPDDLFQLLSGGHPGVMPAGVTRVKITVVAYF
jgi:hypothetical protein